MKSKHIPLRMCIGCSEMKPKNVLLRITGMHNGEKKEMYIDIDGNVSGRGAYVCKNIDCIKSLKKSRRLEKLFSQSFSEKIYEKLEEVVSKSEQ